MPAKTLAAATAATFFVLAVYCLYRTHPAEDAFILFKYADNFAAGHGIVFNVGGPRAEGATDFLWFIFVSLFVAVGMDVAVAAGFVNAIGAGLAAWVLLNQIKRSPWREDRPIALALAAYICLAVLFVGGSVAAYTGFGSMLFAGFVVLLVSLLIEPTRRNLILTPLLSLTVGLIRPDGLFFAFGAVLIALILAWRSGTLKPFLFSSIIATLVGGIYFYWRYKYFGLLLPLPLYVKGHGGESLPGLSSHIAWLKSTAGPTALILALAIMAIAAIRQSRPTALFLLLLLLPAMMHLGVLLFAHHFQNIAYRFQAPDYMLILLCLTCMAALLAERASPNRRRLFALVLMLAILPAIGGGARNVWRYMHFYSYMDRYSHDVSRALTPQHTIALTEAGRLAYWTNAQIIDVVGLNTPDTAVKPVTVEYLRRHDPDIVMFNPADAANPDALVPHDPPPAVPTTGAQLASTVVSAFRPIMEEDEAKFFGKYTAIQFAPVVLMKYLGVEQDRYDVFLLAYPNNAVMYSNVIAFKRTLPGKDKLVEQLNHSFDTGAFKSYAALKGFPLTN